MRPIFYAALTLFAAGCLTDTNSTGKAILYGTVRTGTTPEPNAFVRIYTDYAAGCDTTGSASGDIAVEADGSFRVKDDGPVVKGGTCYSLRAYNTGDVTQYSPRLKFVLHFRSSAPYDSVAVNPVIPVP